MLTRVRYLLFQIRKPDDPMARHEIECFSKALDCLPEHISIVDLLTETPSTGQLDAADVLLIGGSGDYSTTGDAPWLDATYDLLRSIHEQQRPMFGSCWGFQALAKALGGEVIHDMKLAELGTPEIELTAEGLADPVFGPLGDRFRVPVGHEDSVVRLPDNCTLLGKSNKANHILKCNDRPIYATQFHPELDRDGLVERIRVYPRYVEKIWNTTFDEFAHQCVETPKMKEILPRFLQLVLD